MCVCVCVCVCVLAMPLEGNCSGVVHCSYGFEPPRYSKLFLFLSAESIIGLQSRCLGRERAVCFMLFLSVIKKSNYRMTS